MMQLIKWMKMYRVKYAAFLEKDTLESLLAHDMEYMPDGMKANILISINKTEPKKDYMIKFLIEDGLEYLFDNVLKFIQKNG